MRYRRSPPLRRWLDERAKVVDVVARGHAQVGGVTGPGAPEAHSKPLAHAYVLILTREFQGFVRQLHSLAIDVFVEWSGADVTKAPKLVTGLRSGRALDRGNATHDSIKKDFARLSLPTLGISSHNSRWGSGDAKSFDLLLRLRNALAHGNEQELDRLLEEEPVRDSVSWARGQRPMLNRYAKALDRAVWDALVAVTRSEPWS